jgi:hypothetical protein
MFNLNSCIIRFKQKTNNGEVLKPDMNQGLYFWGAALAFELWYFSSAEEVAINSSFQEENSWAGSRKLNTFNFNGCFT